ncbi:MAG: Sec-independent protein translocase protein TatB [Pseudomonadota bacterium]
MFDIGWSEMGVVAVLALLIIGPKELPKAMKMVAYWVRKIRGVTREFQSGFNEMVREAELEETRKSLEAAQKGDLTKTVADTIDPTGTVSAAAKDLNAATKDPLPDKTASEEGAKDMSQSGSNSNFRARDALKSNPVGVEAFAAAKAEEATSEAESGDAEAAPDPAPTEADAPSEPTQSSKSA